MPRNEQSVLSVREGDVHLWCALNKEPLPWDKKKLVLCLRVGRSTVRLGNDGCGGQDIVAIASALDHELSVRIRLSCYRMFWALMPIIEPKSKRRILVRRKLAFEGLVMSLYRCHLYRMARSRLWGKLTCCRIEA